MFLPFSCIGSVCLEFVVIKFKTYLLKNHFEKHFFSTCLFSCSLWIELCFRALLYEEHCPALPGRDDLPRSHLYRIFHWKYISDYMKFLSRPGKTGRFFLPGSRFVKWGIPPCRDVFPPCNHIIPLRRDRMIVYAHAWNM